MQPDKTAHQHDTLGWGTVIVGLCIIAALVLLVTWSVGDEQIRQELRTHESMNIRHYQEQVYQDQVADVLDRHRLAQQLDALAAHLGLALVYDPAQTTPGRWVVRPVEALSFVATDCDQMLGGCSEARP